MAVISVVLAIRLGSLRFSRRWLTASLRYAVPLIPHSVAQWGLFLADRLILPRFVASTQVGLYALGGMVGTIASFAVIAFNRATSPVVLGELKARGRQDEYVPLIGTYVIAAMVVTCLAVAVVGDDAIRIIAPPEYHGATAVVPWVVLGFFLMGVYTVLLQGTLFSMRTGWIAPISVIAAAVNVGLCFLLIPEYGFEAAAWATAIAFGVLALLHGLLAWRLYPIPWEYGRWAKLALAGVAAYLVAEWASPSPPVAGAAFGLLAAGGALLVILTTVRFWRPGEVAAVRGLLRA